MTVYVDLVFLINYCYDFLLLMTVSVALKRYAKLWKLVLGALIGSASLIVLFFNIPMSVLLIVKILTSIVMCLMSYGFKSCKYSLINMGYLYMCSVILAGFLYFLNIELSYEHQGIIFFYSGLSVNYILLFLIGPIILYLYIMQNRRLKAKQNLYYQVRVVLKNNQELKLNGYIDTGNKLVDPITKKRVIIVEKKAIKQNMIRSPIYVPYKTVNYKGLLKCFSPKEIIISNHIFNNYLLGIFDGKFQIEDTDCILNYKMMEDLNV